MPHDVSGPLVKCGQGGGPQSRTDSTVLARCVRTPSKNASERKRKEGTLLPPTGEQFLLQTSALLRQKL